AGLRPAEFADSLPVAALTCVDPRLNPLIPEVLGIPEEQFIWLRNAGNIITGPVSSTMRSLALACALKGAREIVIIGHTDCLVCKTSTLELLERLAAFGVERRALPENLTEFFGLFASERQNVIRGCDIVRHSPLIGPKIPVHGLVVDVHTGRLEWIVNGYQQPPGVVEKWNEAVGMAGQTVEALKSLADFQIGEMKFPETKIGETVTRAGDWLTQKIQELEVKPASGEAASTIATAASLAEKIIEMAEKHWPRPPEAPPSPPAKPPKLPPPIGPKPKFKR
ncbi:MAG: carbonic anhydrase, partial [Verrucomicrobiae bacterium]|nr:carbonic anhydrase [Verrucomicrobiae bacterium]